MKRCETKEEKRGKRWGTKGLVLILGIILGLGLLTFPLAAQGLRIGGGPLVQFWEPLVGGGDLYLDPYNAGVEAENEWVNDYKDWLESLGADVTVNSDEKMDRGWGFEVYVEKPITSMLAIRGIIEYVTSTVGFGYSASGDYFDPWLFDFVTEDSYEETTQVSNIGVGVKPTFYFTKGKLSISGGAGIVYNMPKISFTEKGRWNGLLWGTAMEVDGKATLRGNGWGWNAFLQAEYRLGDWFLGFLGGYKGTNNIDTKGTYTETGVWLYVPYDFEEEWTQPVNLTGIYLKITLARNI